MKLALSTEVRPSHAQRKLRATSVLAAAAGGAAGTIAGGQAGPVRGRLRQARRHRAAEEAVDRALAEDHVALVSHLTHDARPSQSTGLGPA